MHTYMHVRCLGSHSLRVMGKKIFKADLKLCGYLGDLQSIAIKIGTVINHTNVKKFHPQYCSMFEHLQRGEVYREVFIRKQTIFILRCTPYTCTVRMSIMIGKYRHLQCNISVMHGTALVDVPGVLFRQTIYLL